MDELLPSCPECGVVDPRPDIAGSPLAKIISYNDCHEVAVELGYPSLTEALEHLDELKAATPPAPVEQDVEKVAAALYADWIEEDFGNEYAEWALLGDKDTWRRRARAVVSTLTPARAEGFKAEVERYREALAPFAAIEPSSLYPRDGSEAEEYFVVLRGIYDNPLAFTGADLARARQALEGKEG